MLIHQIVNGDRVRLAQASLTKVVGRDRWSVTVETTGLNDGGEQVTFRIGMSLNEVALLTGAGGHNPVEDDSVVPGAS